MWSCRSRSAEGRPAPGRGPDREAPRPLRSGPALLCLLLAAQDARAADAGTIQVRARSTLRIEETARAQIPSGRRLRLQVEVLLSDPAGDQPLAGEQVVLWIAGFPGSMRVVRSEADGRARATFPPLQPGSYLVIARYAGDGLRDAAESRLKVDLLRRAVRLGLSAPPQVQIGEDLPISVDLLEGPAEIERALEVSVDGVRVPITGRRASLLMDERAGLGRLRAGRVLTISARFPGDGLHGEQVEERRVTVATRARAELVIGDLPQGSTRVGAREAAVEQGASLRLSGAAADQEGPLGEVAVEVRITDAGEERVLRSAKTDADGRFEVMLPRLQLPTGQARLVAVVLPGRSFRHEGRSAPVTLTVLPPQPVSLLHYALPLIVSALALTLWFVSRERARLFALLRASLRHHQRQRSGAADAGPGVILSERHGPLSRRSAEMQIDGHVVDAMGGGPIRAEIEVSWGDPSRTSIHSSDEHGRFSISGLGQGACTLKVSAPGYLAEEFSAQLPHRGELRGVRVALLSVKSWVLTHWLEAAWPLFPTHDAARTYTPRELFQMVRARAPGGALLAPLLRLTDLVEEACYSPRPLGEEALIETDEMARRVIEAIAAALARGALSAAPAPKQRRSAVSPQPRL